jgi:sulfur-oxidizing protein SoxA
MKYLYRVLISLLGLVVLTVTPWAQSTEVKSGYSYLTEATQEMQDDEFANPGMKNVEEGRKWFYQKGVNGKSCVTCHGEEGGKFNKQHLASYPVYNAEFEKPFTLQEQINFCWEEHLDNVPFVYDCVDLIELETYVRHLARDETVNVTITDELKSFFEKGKALYHTRFGQIDMSCASCHDQFSGQMLRGQRLSQGQSNGYPSYRLGSGKVTGLHSRFAECFKSFRAEPFDLGSQEYVNLELYLNARGNGLKIETPAVRY